MTDVINFLKEAVITGDELAAGYARPIKRDLYISLLEKPRMHIIYGMRGSGKTTLLFQRFADYPKGKRIYITGDEMSLLGLSFTEIFRNLSYIIETKNAAVFLDEVTKIPRWEEELKIIYDKYPGITVYVSGSSAVELMSSKRTLARRAHYHHLLPMTFREFMRIVHGIEIKRFNLFATDVYTEVMRFDIYFKETVEKNPVGLVEEYISKSQPFMLEANEAMLMDLMNKIIYEDIAKTYKFERDVLNKFHRFILILANSEKTSYENISKDIGVSKGVVGEMIRALIDSGVIKSILPYGAGRIAGRKTWRYFFLAPAIRRMYMKKAGANESLIEGLTKEDIFVSHLEDVFYLNGGPDFVYKDMVFEVGSRTKGFEQLMKYETKKPKFIVYNGVDIVKKEDILKFPFYIFLSHL